MDIKIIVNELKEALKPYNFIQKGTSRIFYYDCGWYLILAEVIQMKTRSGIKTTVITGLNFMWDNSFSFSIREDAYSDVSNYSLDDFSQLIKEDICKWIDSKKEYFLKTYENPLNMLPYLKKHHDIHHQPHGYIISRIFNDKTETKYFENDVVHLLKEYNDNHSIYFLPSDYRGEKEFRELEAFVNAIIKMNDNEFATEINDRINMKRKKLKLKLSEKYL